MAGVQSAPETGSIDIGMSGAATSISNESSQASMAADRVAFTLACDLPSTAESDIATRTTGRHTYLAERIDIDGGPRLSPANRCAYVVARPARPPRFDARARKLLDWAIHHPYFGLYRSLCVQVAATTLPARHLSRP
ncbi:hypothetical protein AB0B25_17280 [Nocardia sp. NPDC049190]|uniref:hypothetical protein n=1 Tax=Nocardia sp. NPDC049190 TaxID=3155650 RepID=UPI0033F812F1